MANTSAGREDALRQADERGDAESVYELGNLLATRGTWTTPSPHTTAPISVGTARPPHSSARSPS